jgi:DNA-binding response OmpR family regulator
VVVAEDDVEMRRMLAEALQEEGYEVTEIKDGGALRRFIENAGKVPPYPAADLLISDIRMPGYTGLEVLQALRMFDWALPVILITAFGDEKTHEEALRLGAEKVYNKPFDLEQFVSEVRNRLPVA